MTPSALYAVRCLVAETFRQSLASRIFWIMLGVSGLCILLCLSISLEGGPPLRSPNEIELYGGDNKPLTGPNPRPGYVSVGFGAFRLTLFRDGEAEIRFLMALFAKWVAGAGGLLLALVWTAGFLPEFLQPQTASVLLAKPVPRWCLLAGKYLGVVGFMAFQAAVFFGGTYLALGIRTGFWLSGYLWGIPLFVVSFAAVYSFSVLLAVSTRSTIACVFGSVLFWLLCFAMNYGRHEVVARPALAPELPPYPAMFRALVEAGYWMLPKPVDLGALLDGALNAEEHFRPVSGLEVVQQTAEFQPDLSVATSLLFGMVILGVSARQLGRIDY